MRSQEHAVLKRQPSSLKLDGLPNRCSIPSATLFPSSPWHLSLLSSPSASRRPLSSCPSTCCPSSYHSSFPLPWPPSPSLSWPPVLLLFSSPWPSFPSFSWQLLAPRLPLPPLLLLVSLPSWRPWPALPPKLSPFSSLPLPAWLLPFVPPPLRLSSSRSWLRALPSWPRRPAPA